MKKLIFIALAVCATRLVSAAEVTEETATRAAEGFVTADAVGKVVLAGCTVDSVVARGRLWIAHLAPSGHVILSGSDLVDPIVGFSKNDFVEPDSESPAFAVLEGADASIAAREAQGGGTRHERWTKLLGGGTSKKGLLKAADTPASEAVVVEPFLQTHYDQVQPYNDYCPIFEANTNAVRFDLYRGRCPCGCVATAAAQIYKHFNWPARIDKVVEHNHSFTQTNGSSTEFPLRFDGNALLDWSAISTNYPSATTNEVHIPLEDDPGWYRIKHLSDLRGTVVEGVRYPIARLIMWMDVYSMMSFKPRSSSAWFGNIASAMSDWYTAGSWVDVDDGRVVSDLQAGIPVAVGIDGHEVIGHGWASDGISSYIYLNYGWGGSNDGYYNTNGSTIDLPFQASQTYVGHYPRAKPQLDPLPKVCGTDLALNWHFPDFYTNNLSGFTVSISRTATTPSTFLDDFSASSGSSSSSEIYIDNKNNLLYSDYAASGNFTYAQSYILTSASELSFKVSSYAAISSTMKIQARFNGGDWQTVSTPDLDAGFGSNNWSTYRIYLGGHGGETAQFRIVREWGGRYYIDGNENRVDYGSVSLDDFTVTNVLAPVEPEIMNVGKTARSLALNELAAGATYSFTVTPNISDALVAGESSESVSTSIAGTRNTPIPGEQTYTPTTLTFSASDSSGTWSYSGTAVDDTTILDKSRCSISVAISGTLTASTSLSFGWSANNYYGDGSDTLTAVFTAIDGTAITVWEATNAANIDRQNVNVSLGELSGLSGKLTISCNHSGHYYVGDQYGGRLYAPQITNVLVPSVPAIAWHAETLTALGTPEILSVSAVTEGFYGECGTNASVFAVACSAAVDTLEARPSHLALVRDEDVVVEKTGSGKFRVVVTPSGVNEGNLRSRMMLTLVATDTNGTKSYKDLSLRFSEVDQSISEVVVSAQTSDGERYSVSIPYSWIEEKGLVSPGSEASAYERFVSTDTDGDGFPNWAEFVCGTNPTNANDKLTVTIRLEDGQPVVETSPTAVLDGFRAVKKGSNDLKIWTVETDTKESTNHFFKVVIEPINNP